MSGDEPVAQPMPDDAAFRAALEAKGYTLEGISVDFTTQERDEGGTGWSVTVDYGVVDPAYLTSFAAMYWLYVSYITAPTLDEALALALGLPPYRHRQGEEG